MSKGKRHGAAFSRREAPQSKELKEQSGIATRNDYAPAAARSDNLEVRYLEPATARDDYFEEWAMKNPLPQAPPSDMPP